MSTKEVAPNDVLREALRTSNPELLADYLALQCTAELAEPERSLFSPGLRLKAERLYRSRLFVRQGSDTDRNAAEKGAAERNWIKYTGIVARIRRWSQRPLVATIFKWVVAGAGAGIGALSLQQLLVGPRLVALSARIVVASDPSITPEPEIQRLSGHLWLSRFATEKLQNIASPCVTGLNNGSPSVDCINAVLPDLETIISAESGELDLCNEVETSISETSPNRMWVPGARRFFETDFVGPPLRNNGWPDSRRWDYRQQLARAATTEYGCLVRQVLSDAYNLRRLLRDHAAKERTNILRIDLRNTRTAPSEPLAIVRLRVGDAVHNVHVTRLDDAGWLQASLGKIAFPPQDTVGLIIVLDDISRDDGEKVLRDLAMGSTTGALELDVPWYQRHLPLSESEVALSFPAQSVSVAESGQTDEGLDAGGASWSSMCAADSGERDAATPGKKVAQGGALRKR